ncbi:polypeptide N-acetylgalactosaminyltransferase 5 [Sarcoptes scabiei]|nr:polypeptide N-acetylgalactosaminyltransferase 5 [Sarcoptes scabiei]
MNFTTMNTIIGSKDLTLETPILISLILIYAILIFIGAFGNGLVCLAVARNSRMRTTQNLFIVNLAISDLLLCFFTIPFSLVEIATKFWPYGVTMCKLVLTLEATSIFVSTLSIIAIALDRYYVILCSVNPENCRQERVPILLKLVIIWIIGLILSLPLFLVRTVESHFIGMGPIETINFCIEKWPIENGRAYYSVLSMLIQYVGPIIIVSVVYTRLCMKLRSRTLRRTSTTQLPKLRTRLQRRARKTNILLISIALIFFISWLPLNVLNIVADFFFPVSSFRITFAICHMFACCSRKLPSLVIKDDFSTVQGKNGDDDIEDDDDEDEDVDRIDLARYNNTDDDSFADDDDDRNGKKYNDQIRYDRKHNFLNNFHHHPHHNRSLHHHLIDFDPKKKQSANYHKNLHNFHGGEDGKRLARNNLVAFIKRDIHGGLHKSISSRLNSSSATKVSNKSFPLSIMTDSTNTTTTTTTTTTQTSQLNETIIDTIEDCNNNTNCDDRFESDKKQIDLGDDNVDGDVNANERQQAICSDSNENANNMMLDAGADGQHRCQNHWPANCLLDQNDRKSPTLSNRLGPATTPPSTSRTKSSELISNSFNENNNHSPHQNGISLRSETILESNRCDREKQSKTSIDLLPNKIDSVEDDDVGVGDDGVERDNLDEQKGDRKSSRELRNEDHDGSREERGNKSIANSNRITNSNHYNNKFKRLSLTDSRKRRKKF